MQTTTRNRLSGRLANAALVILSLAAAAVAHAAGLSVSSSANRANATDLQGATLPASGNVYIFAINETGLVRAVFYLDRPTTATPNVTENVQPFDFATTAASGDASPLSTSTLSAGTHTLSAVLTYQSGAPRTITASFNVASPPPPPVYTLQLSPNADRSGGSALDGKTLSANSAYIFVQPATNVARVDFYVDNATTPISTETLAPLDFNHTAPNGTAIAWNPTTLGQGTHTMRAVVTPTSGSAQTVTSPFTVSMATTPPANPAPGDRCAPVICSQIRVALPYTLEFNGDAGHLLDASGSGTGFTQVLPSGKGARYVQERLIADPTRGLLGIVTTPGIFNQAINTHSNVIGVGFTGQAQTARITTRLVNPPNGTKNYEQAGLWFGYDEDHYFKLVYESAPEGNVVEILQEHHGQTVKSTRVPVNASVPASVQLQFIVDPYNQLVTGYYAIGNNDLVAVTQPIAASPEYFSFDAAGIDPVIGTRSFAGIFATNRNGPHPLTYWFDNFAVLSNGTSQPPAGPISFDKISYSVPVPTNMVWGPDNRLYVTEMYGRIHALTFNANLQVTRDDVYTSLVNMNGSRLTLGIAVDPASTPTDVRLWVAHSSPSEFSGQLNSGTITRLSGPNFSTTQHVITGLPRAFSNHAPNSLHFGPDGRLYIAIGGNTGTGSPTDAPNEFGDRPEQWLSAAIVAANVNAPDFDGTCAPPTVTALAPCDVQLYATGIRNTYDFVFHSNGQMYATDNGLGVTGAYPPTTTPPCFGTGSSKPWNGGGHNPGTQPDLLLRIVQGKYYGHPNPARGECVFKDGSMQRVAPLPNYTPPLASLGDHLSADGITEYKSTLVCGAQGSLLIANYSLGQNITQVKLSPDGLAVTGRSTLVSGLAGPLAITTNPAGIIFVSELNSGLVTALRYAGPPCSN